MAHQYDSMTAEQVTAEINRAGGDQVSEQDVAEAIKAAGNLGQDGRVDYLRFLAWLMKAT